MLYYCNCIIKHFEKDQAHTKLTTRKYRINTYLLEHPLKYFKTSYRNFSLNVSWEELVVPTY